MCLPIVFLSVLATNLFELAQATRVNELIPPYELAATVTHVIPTDCNSAGIRILEVGLSDDSSPFCIRIMSSAASWPLAAGDTIHLQQTNSSEWAAYYDGTAGLVSRSEPRPPIRTDADAILHGRCDYQFVKTRGLLRNVQISELNTNWTWIVLKCGRQNLYAATPTHPHAPALLKPLLGAEIAVEGIVLPHDGSKRHRIGRILHFAGTNSIGLIRKPSDGSLAAPDLEKIENLPPSEIASLPRHSVQGRILVCWDRNKALLRTGRNKICRIEFQSETLPKAGEMVIASGYPECDLQSINLSDAQWSPATYPSGNRSGGTSQTNEHAVWISRLDCHCPYQLQHGSLVILRGTVVSIPSSGNNDHMLNMNCDGQIIPINPGPSRRAFDGLHPGTIIDVTGICVNEVENYSSSRLFPRVTGVFLVIRTPSDIRIVAHPPWWTPMRLYTLIGTLLTIIVGIFLWNIALRHAATRKGRELFREQLGHVRADLKTEERTRLAVELHDTLAQNLTGVSMEIEAAHELRGNAPQPMLDHLGIAAKALKSCRDELRNCLWDLRSQALEEQDMTKAALKTLQPVVNDSRLAVRFNVPRAQLSDNTAHALLRVIRELVINAIRHGNAGSVKVAGTIDRGKLLCSVTDDGCGFDPEAAPGVLQGHFGLQGIQERIDELGGTFEIASAPGSGTKATISVPIPHEC